jgi:hypothetical protein
MSVGQVNCCWSSPAHSFLILGPAGLTTHDSGSGATARDMYANTRWLLYTHVQNWGFRMLHLRQNIVKWHRWVQMRVCILYLC